MVSVNRLGGVGNEMFQIAAAYCFSLKYSMDYAIPIINDNPHLNQEPFLFPNVKYSGNIPELPIYTEPSFEYSPIPYMPNVYLRGYYQSYLYHYQYKPELLKLFNIPVNFKEGLIFLHLRLGDYKTLGKFHQIISDSYITDSLAWFSARGHKKFFILSDEIEEAKKMINSERFTKLQFEYSEGKTELEDLSLMASCEGGIMSASSFSWWGSYLGTNENRQIIYPKKWFGESLSNHSTKDLCPKSWLAL